MVIEKEIKLINPKFGIKELYHGCHSTKMECLTIVDTYVVPNGFSGDSKDTNLVRIREVDGEPYLTVKGPDMSSGMYKEREEFEVPVASIVKDAICGLGEVSLVLKKQRYIFDYRGVETFFDTVYGVFTPNKDVGIPQDSPEWFQKVYTTIFEAEDLSLSDVDNLSIVLDFSKDDLTTVSNYDYFMELISKVVG